MTTSVTSQIHVAANPANFPRTPIARCFQTALRRGISSLPALLGLILRVVLTVCMVCPLAPEAGASTASTPAVTVQSAVFLSRVTTTARLVQPSSIAVDSAGNVFIVDENTMKVLKETPTPTGFLEEDIWAAISTTWKPSAIAIDSSNTLYITTLNGGGSEGANGQVIELIAGSNGKYNWSALGFSGLLAPLGIAVDRLGNAYVSDTGNKRIVEFGPSTNGTQSVLGISGLSVPEGIAVDAEGDLYIADTGNSRVVKEAPGSSYTQTVLGSGFLSPVGVAVFGTTVYVADTGNMRIEKLTESSGTYTQSQLAGAFPLAPYAIALNGNGNVFYTDVSALGAYEVTQSAGPLYLGPIGVNDISQSATITFKFTSGGQVGAPEFVSNGLSTNDFLKGTGQTTCAAQSYATGATCTVSVEFTPQVVGAIYGAVVIPVSSTGSPAGEAYVYGTGLAPYLTFSDYSGLKEYTGTNTSAVGPGIAVDYAGYVYFADGASNTVYKARAGVVTKVGSGLSRPSDVALDGAGNLYILDAGNNRIVKEEPEGSSYSQSVVYTETATAVGIDDITADGFGNVYFVSGESVTTSGHTVSEWNLFEDVQGPGGGYSKQAIKLESSTGATLTLSHVSSLAVDEERNLYLVEDTTNAVLQFSAPFANNYTFVEAPDFSTEALKPTSVAVDPLGNVYVSDGEGNDVIEVSPAGVKTKITGHLTMSHPAGLAVDNNGNILVAETGNSRIDQISFAKPSLTFANVQENTTQSESLTLFNYGNVPLTFPVPKSGSNPATAAPFSFGSSSTCPTLTSTSTEPGTLDPWDTCTVAVEFSPKAAGNFSGSVLFIDSSLNASYAEQVIQLGGQATALQPTLSWSSPAAITYGTPLSATQLNATATYNGAAVAGTFTYIVLSGGSGEPTISVGTVLAAGNYVLQATFTPANTNEYAGGKITATILVNPAPLTVVADSFMRYYGSPNPTFTASYIGLVNGDTPASLSGAPALTTEATQQFPWGIYTITIAQGTLSSSNYTFPEFVNGTLFINPAPLTITATSVSITQGSTIPTLTWTATGFKNGDTAAKVLSGAPAESTTATSSSPAGTYPIAITQGTLSALNYTFVFVNGTLTISPPAAEAPKIDLPESPTVNQSNTSTARSIMANLTDTTPGAVIHFTTDGSTPTANSKKYTGPITLDKTTTIQAIAVARGYRNSVVARLTYTIN